MPKRIPALEAALAVWIAIWVLVGWLVYREVKSLAKLGGTVVLAGASLEQTATALDSVKNLPFVGGDVGRLAENARVTAHSAIVNGRQARRNVDQLAVLLWITVAATPTLPAVLWYGWLRRNAVVVG
jgi:hypothetical protein